jgi:hypothetical protein
VTHVDPDAEPQRPLSLCYTGAELGVETGTFPIVRGFLGAGYGRRTQNDSFRFNPDLPHPPPPPGPRGSPVFWPGIAVLFPVGRAFFGAESRLLLWPRPDIDGRTPDFMSLGFAATAGLRF